MNNEYIALPLVENDLGLLTVNKAVAESIASTAILELSDVKLAERTTLRNPISCKIVDNSLNMTVNIRIKYNCNIADTCLSVQNKINQALKQMIDLSCTEIDVRVVGFVF